MPDGAPIVDVANLLDKSNAISAQIIKKMTNHAANKMIDVKFHLDLSEQAFPKWKRTVITSLLNRQNTTREMMGLALHLNFNCDNHFARNTLELTLKYYHPQK